MTRKRQSPLDAREAQLAAGADEASIGREQIGRWPVGCPFPALLTDADLRAVLGVSWSTFYRLKKLDRFRDLVASPVLTPTARYSGFLVAQWVRGEATAARSLGGRQRRAQQLVAVK
jgi:hypothetical protein